MEHKHFVSNDLSHSPHPSKGFQADRFIKKTSGLSIPDTIPENCSAEFSGQHLNMEVPKIIIECVNGDNKVNISCNLEEVVTNDSLNDSIHIAIDNSYIKQCEKKLLDSSNSDDERNNEFESMNKINNQLFKVSRCLNDTISTPPSLLRREISMLRTEMAEVHEFHDLEIKLLKEEKFLTEVNPNNSTELLEKYSTLMELYTALKISYDEYRKAQEKISRELQSKTADCLESLCSQIEASDNSLNISSASFVSFGGGIRSSTMVEDISEVEATVLHDATVLANDPLSITSDIFKTPTQTPVRNNSAKELFPPNSTARKPTVKDVKEIIANTTTPLDSDYNIQLLNLETALDDKIREVRDLEQRLFKVEDLSSVLKNEFERMNSIYAKETDTLKENLSTKSKELNELTQTLFTETISLNPSLKDSLIDAPGKKLMLVFMETIMENCKKIQCDDAMAAVENLQKQLASKETQLMELEDMRKSCDNLKRKLSDAENMVLTRDEEIRMLQSHLGNVRQTREDLARTKEALSELEARLTLQEAEKIAAESRCLELETIVKNLNGDIEEKERLQAELKARLTLQEAEKIAAESRCLELETIVKNLNRDIEEKERLQAELKARLTLQEAEKIAAESRCLELETIVKNLNRDIEEKERLQAELKARLPTAEEQISIKESLSSAIETIEHLKSQVKMIEEEKLHLQTLCNELQDTNTKLLSEVNSVDKIETEVLKQRIAESEKFVAELKTELDSTKDLQKNNSNKVEELLKEIEQLHSEKSGFSKALEKVETSLAGLLSDVDNKTCLRWFDKLQEINDNFSELVTRTLSMTEFSSSDKLKDSVKQFPSVMKKLVAHLNTLEENMREMVDENSEIEEFQSKSPIIKPTLLDELKEIIANSTTPLDSEENTQLDLECEKPRKVLEERLFKMEDLSLILQNEFERINSVFIKENNTLKERLCVKNEQLNELTHELVTEVISLNPSLKESLIDAPGKKLLFVYKETVMEYCKNIETEDAKKTVQNLQNQLASQETKLVELEDLRKICEDLESKLADAEKTSVARDEEIQLWERSLNDLRQSFENLETKLSEAEMTVETRDEEIRSLQTHLDDLKKTCENLEGKLSEAEKMTLTREEEIQKLQTHLGNVKQTEEDLASTKEALSELESKLAVKEAEKQAVENQRVELEATIEKLNSVIEEKENLLKTYLSFTEEQKAEHSRLKEMYDALEIQMAETVETLKSKEIEIITIKESLSSAEGTIQQLKSQLKALEEEKSHLQSQCNDLQGQKLLSGINETRKNEIVESLKHRIAESEKLVTQLMGELESAKECQKNNTHKFEEMVKEIEQLNDEKSGVSKMLDSVGRNLTDMWADVEGATVLPSDRVNQMIEGCLREFASAEMRNSTTLKVLGDTISKTCKGVQNHLIKSFEREKHEWTTQRDLDTTLIQNLKQEVKDLMEKGAEYKTILAGVHLEKAKLMKLNDSLQNQTNDAEKMITSCNNEIKSRENALKRTKNDLTTAEKTIEKLKAQLSTTEKCKIDIEVRCRELENVKFKLEAEIRAKEVIIKQMNGVKVRRQEIESENSRVLKEKIRALEEEIERLKKSLETAQEKQTRRELNMKNWENEIEQLKKDKEGLLKLTEKLGNLEKNNQTLLGVISEVQTQLDIPENTLRKILSGELETNKIFSDRINNLIKEQTEVLKSENKHLKLGNDHLKEKVKQLTLHIKETLKESGKEDLSNSNVSSNNFRSNSGRKSDMWARRLDKLEEINDNLTELVSRMLTMTQFPETDKLKLYSVRDFPNVMKKVVSHLNSLEEKTKEVKEENAQLDEECETYAKIIKDLKREAATVWKTNQEKTEAMETEINRLQKEKNGLEKEKKDLLEKISKLDVEFQKLKSSKSEGCPPATGLGNDSKKINELKRTILMKEQKLLELQDLESQTSSFKAQIEYLKNALEREKKKIGEERDRNKRLQMELTEAGKKHKTDEKPAEENQMLDELRMRGSLTGGIVQEFVDKEKMRKLSKDIGILKELCRARYAEIKRLEAVNADLRNNAPKNINQMDSPIRTRGYITRSKDLWKSEGAGKENSAL